MRISHLLTASLLLPLLAQAELKLPAIIGDNMVLQQNQEDPIWGWDNPGTQVTVTWAGQSQSATADANGKWQVKLKVGKASATPASLSIKGTSTRELKNVLVGEVWVCSGQSNMQWSVRASHDSDLEIAAATHPQIRLISVPQVGTQEPKNDFTGSWAECNPETIPNFSAVGYFFGRQLHEVLRVPVGLINNAWGGSAAEAWIRRDVLEKDARFSRLMADTVKREADLQSPAAKANYEKQVAAYKERAAAAKAAKKPFNERAPGSPASWLTGNARPGNIYNGVLLPTIGYGIKGAIWYQGESNAGRAYEYRDLFPLMITHWRSEWKQGDFPFYWVQLADFMAEKATAQEANASSWAELREAQTLTMSALKNGGQAVITDIGEGKDIHPRNKRDVAERLARWALAKDYGFSTLPHRSADLKEAKFEGNKATVTLNTYNAGPLAVFDVNEALGFTLCGEDKVWHWATGKIIGADKIEVTSDKVAKPIAVRYAWADNPKVNLYTAGHNLPVTPFRSDNFEMLTKPKP